MAKHHTITTIIGVVIALGGVHTAHAQTAYSKGYYEGYYDGRVNHIPLSGTPDHSTEYGRGWNAGRDDDDEDFDRMMHHVDKPSSPTADPPSSSIQNEQELSDLREQLEAQRMAAMSLETELEIQRIHQEMDAELKPLMDEVERVNKPLMDSLQHPLPTTAELLQGLNH